jgi:hypothetical protein
LDQHFKNNVRGSNPRGVAWRLPGLSQEFAGQFEELYKLCVNSVKVRQRTQGWIEVMREVSG